MKMKRKLRKFLLMLSSAILLVSISVGATVAYLTDTDVVVNTFTVGNVQITLDEADVDIYGEEIKGADRVKANEYKLIPGHQYKKDPTLHVLEGSEDAWVRMLVTVNKHAELKQALEAAGLTTMIDSSTGVVLLQNMVEGWDITKWVATATVNNDGSAVYEFRYKSIVSAKEAQQDVKLFDNFTLPGAITNKQIPDEAEGTTYLGKLEGLTITVEGHAIQADGFGDDYNAAWDTGWKVNHPD